MRAATALTVLLTAMTVFGCGPSTGRSLLVPVFEPDGGLLSCDSSSVCSSGESCVTLASYRGSSSGRCWPNDAGCNALTCTNGGRCMVLLSSPPGFACLLAQP